MSSLVIRARVAPSSGHIQRVIDDLELLGPNRKKLSQALVLICLTSTRDVQGLEKLLGYDEDDVVGLVRQRMHRLRDLQHSCNDGTREHQLALILCVFELAQGIKDHRQPRLLDDTRTFQQNRQTYLSILGIDSDATYVEIDEIARLIKNCKLLQPDPDVEHFCQLVRPDYLPIRTCERLPWEVQHDITYKDAQKFTVFSAMIAHEFNCAQDDDHEVLFIIFRRLQSTRLGLSAAYLGPLRDRLRNKIRERRSPSELVLYVIASFSLGKDEHTQHTVHEFLNRETNDVSRATVNSLTRALDKAMRAWPVQSEQAEKFISVLLGDAYDGKGETRLSPEDASNRMNWDNYWYLRIESQADHDLAKAMVCAKLYKE